MRKYNTQAIGDEAENLVCEFLTKQGLRLLTSKYRLPYGEIDLVMQDQEDIVFVEVRTRRRIDYGNAFESINRNKMNKLIRTAKTYLQATEWLYTKTSRFDIVVIHPISGVMQIDWIKNAFTCNNW